MLKAYPRHSVDVTKKEYLAILSTILSRKILGGPDAQIFEEMFARYIGTRFAIAMPSARLGLHALFKYFCFPEGSEVILTPFTHWSIFSVIKSAKMKPVFVDVDERTYNIAPRLVEKQITDKTKLIILTHMWGQPCEMEPFLQLKQKYGIKLIEDCAMACGAAYDNQKVGSFADAGIFSFGKAKAINTFGGGMLCTNDPQIYKHIEESTLSFHHQKLSRLLPGIINSVIASILTKPWVFFFTLYPVLKFLNIRDPYNPLEHSKDAAVFPDQIPDDWKVRMSNIQARVGIEKLKKLDDCNQKRINNALLLNSALEQLKEIQVPLTMPRCRHIYLYYPVLIKQDIDLNTLRKRLIAKGVDSQLNELTTAKELEIFGARSADYPIFKKVSEKLLIIPNSLVLDKKDTLYVADAFKNVIKSIN